MAGDPFDYVEPLIEAALRCIEQLEHHRARAMACAEETMRLIQQSREITADLSSFLEGAD